MSKNDVRIAELELRVRLLEKEAHDSQPKPKLDEPVRQPEPEQAVSSSIKLTAVTLDSSDAVKQRLLQFTNAVTNLGRTLFDGSLEPSLYESEYLKLCKQYQFLPDDLTDDQRAIVLGNEPEFQPVWPDLTPEQEFNLSGREAKRYRKSKCNNWTTAHGANIQVKCQLARDHQGNHAATLFWPTPVGVYRD